MQPTEKGAQKIIVRIYLNIKIFLIASINDVRKQNLNIIMIEVKID